VTAATTDWRSVAELRQGLYRFFAGALLLPDAARLEVLVAGTGILAGMGVDDFAFSDRWHAMEAALEAVEGVEDLEGEYIRLFVTGSAGPASPPIESHYTGVGDVGQVIAELRRDYAGVGLEVRSGLPYPADHVSTELEIMASLCHREAHAWEEAETAQSVSTLRREWSFLDRHLVRWLPQLARRVGAAAAGGFYAPVVDAAEAFVIHDHQLVTMLARTPVAGVGR
jgi:DMSO reductase family type II enzyme chaperone